MKAPKPKPQVTKRSTASTRRSAADRHFFAASTNPAGPNRNLFDVIERGASVRRHRFFADMRLLLMPAAISAIMQWGTYAAFIIRANRSDWNNLAVVCMVLTIIPFVSALILAGVRSREFPFTLSAVLTMMTYNFGVVVLSALRIPISYTGLLAAAFVCVVIMVLAASRLTRASHEKMAILDFPHADEAADLIGGNVTKVGLKASLGSYDVVLIDGETHHTPAWNIQLTRAQMRGTHVLPWFAVLEQKWGQVTPDHFDISHLAYSPSQIYYTRAKRWLDLLLLTLLAPFLLPLGLLVATYIKVIDRGPVLFVQTRRGYAGKNFRMLKFRTMRTGEHGGATKGKDERILPGCHLLRRFRLDELPQLINILRGEMSWIGPRPVSLEIARQCERRSTVYAARYLVLPGITGWAQVQYGYAGNVKEEIEKLGYDLYYLKRISLDLDLEITFRTFRTLLTGSGSR